MIAKTKKYFHTLSSDQDVALRCACHGTKVPQLAKIRDLDVTRKGQGGCYRNSQLWAGDEVVATPRTSSDMWNTTSVFPITAPHRHYDIFSSVPAELNCKEKVSWEFSRYYQINTVIYTVLQCFCSEHYTVLWRCRRKVYLSSCNRVRKSNSDHIYSHFLWLLQRNCNSS
jgi:hypothetical protein